MNHLRRYNEEFTPQIMMVRMYHFCHDSYGPEYTVLSTSKEEALDNLKIALKERNVFKYAVSDYEDKIWENATIDNLPDGYRVEELKPGEILITEVS